MFNMLIVSTCQSHSNLLENTSDTCSCNWYFIHILSPYIGIFYLQNSCVLCLHVFN